MTTAAPSPGVPAPESTTIGRGEFAAMLSVSVPTIDKLRARGAILPGFKLGKLRRWSRTEVMDYIAAGAPPVEEWARRKKAR